VEEQNLRIDRTVLSPSLQQLPLPPFLLRQELNKILLFNPVSITLLADPKIYLGAAPPGIPTVLPLRPVVLVC
jgi:hypothetical protein